MTLGEMDPQTLTNHKALLQRAWEVLDLDFISEIDLLYEAICSSNKAQHLHPALTGLPSWSHSIHRGLENIKLILSKLDPRTNAELGTIFTGGAEGDEQLTKCLYQQGNEKLPSKLDANIIVLRQAALQWSILKHFHHLRCVSQTFLSTTKDTRKEKLLPITAGADRARMHRTLKEQSKVDVSVVDGGYTWICVRGLKPDRLVRQMTDAGWSWGEHAEGDHVDFDEWKDMPFMTYVQRVVDASRMNRWEYVFPKIILVLTNIDLTAVHPDIKILLGQLHRLDHQVTITIHDATSSVCTAPHPALPTVIRNLVGDPFAGLTPTLNLDHTILIDLISDITHLRLEPQAWQAPTTRAQIEEEQRRDEGVMASTLYPLLQGRRLECTRQAAEHFHEVLRTVGTDTERARGHILVPEPNSSPAAAAQVSISSPPHEAFNALTSRPIPTTIQLPIHIRPEIYTMSYITRLANKGSRRLLPAVAVRVCSTTARNFPPAKRSVYVHGWATGNATLTSNKEIAGQMRTWVEAGRTSDDEKGPLIWRVDVTRNLLAKERLPRGGIGD